MKESSSGRKHWGQSVSVRGAARKLCYGWGGKARGGHAGAGRERAGLNE